LHRFALLIIFLSPAFCHGHDKDQRALLRANVIRELTTYHVSPETYSIIHATDDHLFIVTQEDSPDSVQKAIRLFPGKWKKDPKFWVLVYHHHLDCLNSWRSKSSPSLHITQVGRGIYSIDIDLDAPSLRHPVESVKHFREILWHLVSRTKTDQERISILLARAVQR
jgi:hypothetical protein